ncbi:YqeG family HAD IIIA-type phosphatase [Dubosiella newyorkensis]|uniref:YqeG family HAD IIIA-type phosphatase n=1 Tax=Dubosiella newyorkensis TaxID=1862672 RepID=UPI00272D9997|nr:YqeG family HAD IIIA-type phosphatase [Dubosiella newyorkensis]
MKHYFKPDYYVRNFENIDIQRLKKAGIRLLLCDIDNTLVAYNDPDSNEKVKKFLKKVEHSGLDVALVSNASPKRAKRFAKDLDVEHVFYLSFKPTPRNIKKAMRYYHVAPKQTALLGDQLLTDMLGASLAGCYKILTAPIIEKDKFDTRINRFFENFIYRHYSKKHIFKKGEFDD